MNFMIYTLELVLLGYMNQIWGFFYVCGIHRKKKKKSRIL